jgi:magnesium transporter
MRVEELCAEVYAQSHPIDASHRLEKMPADASAAFLQTLPRSTAGQILAAMQITGAAECLAVLPSETAVDILQDLTPDHAARLLRIMPPSQADALLAASPESLRKQIDRALRYPPSTAGALMDPAVLAVANDLTVAEVQRELRWAARSVYYYIYVVNREHQLVGVMDMRELLTSEKTDVIQSVMRTDPVSVSPLTDIATLAEHPAWKDLDALPVTGRQGKLLGLIRHRRLRQVLAAKGEIRLDQVGATVTRLGEIYWATMGAFVATFATAAAPRILAGNRSGGVND